MATRGGWKTLSPQEQMLQLVRDVATLKEELPQYTRIQGVKLEGRLVAGERRLYAIIDDSSASNDGVEYQLVP